MAPLVDFAIVGTMKGGTSTLSEYLAEHPEVRIPKREVHYFDKQPSGYSAEAYEQAVLSGLDEGPVDSKVVGEKTPAYSLKPWVPEQLADYNPSMRLLWTLRDPVERTHSNYWHTVNGGSERRSFEAALRDELERDERSYVHDYIRRSDYLEQIQRFLEHFDREQLLFIKFETFVREPQPVLSSVLEHLGVDDFEFREPQRANPTRLPRSPGVQAMAQDWFGDSIVAELIQRVNCYLGPGSRPRPSDEAKRIVVDELASTYDELEEITGLELDDWER